MVKDVIKERLAELERKVKNDSPKYKGFKTKPGKDFQKSFKDLTGFVNIGNLVLGLAKFYPFAEEWFGNVLEIIPENTKIKAIKEESFTSMEEDESRDLLKKASINTLQSFRLDNKFKKMISSFMARLNSYFFLALYAYMEFYIEKIYESIRNNLNTTQITNLDKAINKRGVLNKKINAIKKELNLVTREEFGELIRGRKWKTNFNYFLCSRHFMAHEKPLARIRFLESKFKEIAKIAQDQVQIVPKKIATQFNINTLIIQDIFKMFESDIYILFMLIEIGKDCFCYLAMIDILIDDKIKP